MIIPCSKLISPRGRAWRFIHWSLGLSDDGAISCFAAYGLTGDVFKTADGSYWMEIPA